MLSSPKFYKNISSTFFDYCFLFEVLHPGFLHAYSWLCAQVAELKNHVQAPELNLDLP